jgi:hypothetical protein
LRAFQHKVIFPISNLNTGLIAPENLKADAVGVSGDLSNKQLKIIIYFRAKPPL